jgi:crotonobetainyl-CoA:carnitine CoA-transferase CaiB-like acyl-CoA transferase
MNRPAPPDGASAPLPQGAAGARALAGLRVLDFSIMLAGPYGARLLADLGADVVKIEPPEGDDMRLRHPLRADASGRRHSTYFGQLNAGKRSLALDLKQPQAIALVKRLAAEADVVIENFRPGVMRRLGLGADVLREINPRLVYCSVSGYGQAGANAGRAAYAMLVQAESGFERTLARWAAGGEAGGRPLPTATFVADLLGGLYAFAAIQAALVQRARTGEGQVIDVALLDSMLNLLVYELQEAQFPLKAPRPIYGPVAAADGDVLIAPITERNFQALADVTQLPALRDDPRFATLPARSAHWPAMMAAVEHWTRPRPVAEVVRLLEAAGVPCARYNEPADCLQDAALRERGLFAPVSDAAGTFTGVNAPWRMSAAGAAIGARVPAVGEQGDEVLREWLGLDAAAIGALKAAQVLAGPP